MQYSTLRPGLLVSLKTSVTGNVTYARRDLPGETGDDGVVVARWETERTIIDAAEHYEAHKVRSKCRSTITAVCSASTFGLLCPESEAEELSKAIEAAQALATDFNNRAKLTRVAVYVIAGRVAPDDVQAVKAINSEVRDLLDEMEAGLQRLDVKIVREAANKARAIGAMLSPDAQARIHLAIEAARKAARSYVKAAEQGAVEIDKRAIRSIVESRTAFLDLEAGREIAQPQATGRALDLSSEPAAMPQRPVAPAFELDA